MLVDLGRNDLSRVCKPGTVRVERFLEPERFSHVTHLVSEVAGELRDGVTPFDLLRACFPAGTVSGAPKVRAMQIISELEGYRRGVYAGAVGYALPGGALDTCIAIRTMVLRDGVALLQAGGGIVADSDPAAEHQECLNKLAALEAAIELAEASNDELLLVDNYDSFTYNLAHSSRELGAEVDVRGNDEISSTGGALAPTHLVLSPGPGRPATRARRRDRRATRRACRRSACASGTRRSSRRSAARSAARSGCCTARRAASSTTGAASSRACRRARGRALPLARGDARARTSSRSRRAADDGEVMGVRHRELPVDGVQFHPESVLTPLGKELLRNFLEVASSPGRASRGCSTGTT